VASFIAECGLTLWLLIAVPASVTVAEHELKEA
jgi:hypothetical protein